MPAYATKMERDVEAGCASPPNRRASRAGFAAAALAAILLGIASYLPALGGAFVWDDRWLVSGEAIGGGDRLIHCFTRPFMQNYFRPLVSATVFAERAVFGDRPAGYHVVNLALHLFATLAVMGLCHAAFRRREATWVAGALFAVQPVQSAAAAWIGGITDALATMWCALFAWALIAAARSRGRARALRLAAAFLVWTIALFTKEQSLALLPLVPLAFACWKPDGEPESVSSRRAGWMAMIPFTAAGAAFLAISVRASLTRPAPLPSSAAIVADRIIQTAVYYARALLLPGPAALHTYTLDPLARHPLAVIFACGALAAGLTWLTVRLSARNRPALWLLLFALLSLVPVSNAIPLPALLVASYRASLAGVAVAPLMAYGLVSLVRSTRSPRLALAATMVPLLIWHTALCAWTATRWTNEVSLFTTILEADPTAGQARYNLACSLMREGRDSEAVSELERMLQRVFAGDSWRDPAQAARARKEDRGVVPRLQDALGFVETPESLFGMLYGEMGFAQTRIGYPALARDTFVTGEALAGPRPSLETGIAWCDWLTGAWQPALDRVNTLLAQRDWPQARLLRGRILAGMRRWPEASEDLRATAWRDPQSPDALAALAQCERSLGNAEAASRAKAAALRIAPKRGDLEALTRGIP